MSAPCAIRLLALLAASAGCTSGTSGSGAPVGYLCTTSADCANGLACLDVSAHFVAQTATCSGAIATGPQRLCTVACSLSADCTPYAAGGECHRFGCEPNDFCMGPATAKATNSGDAAP